MKKLVLFILFFSEAVMLFAQTQITSADVANILAPGNEWIETSNDTVQATMDIGSASGSSQNWTIPNISFVDTIKATNISPSSSPYSSDFPEATHCQYFSGIVEGVPATSYNYYKLANNALFSLGFASHVQFGGIDTVIILKDTTGLFLLPVTYGTSKVVSSDTTSYIPGYSFIETITQSVDAFGNITFPFGTYPALRISVVTESKTYVNGTLLSSDSQVSFTWISNGGFFQADIDTTTGTSGTVSLTSASLVQFAAAPLAVNESNINSPAGFALYQNYPNPFNPSTKIRYSISPSSSNGSNNLVTLKVYNILGNEVASLVNEEKPAGTYEVEFNSIDSQGRALPSGVYFYKLTNGSFTQTQKMILLK